MTAGMIVPFKARSLGVYPGRIRASAKYIVECKDSLTERHRSLNVKSQYVLTYGILEGMRIGGVVGNSRVIDLTIFSYIQV